MRIHDARRLTSTAMALILGAFFVSVPSIQASAQSQVRPILNAQQCSPLSDENYEICCIALNRSDILSATDIAQCPPLTTSLISNVLAESNGGERRDETAGGSNRAGGVSVGNGISDLVIVTGATGSGGANTGSAGANNGGGGTATTQSGGDTGSGGSPGTTGSGGGDTGSGGGAPGTTGSGGADTGSGGADTGSGGGAPSTTGSGGADTGSGGADTGSGGQE